VNKYWEFTKNQGNPDEPVELRITGDIVDDERVWIYDWFGDDCTSPNAFRNELNEHAGKDLTVWIDSYGGNPFAGAGIYNALKEHDGKITVKIDGKAMSAASVIAMAGDEVLMSPVAMMMIHNPLTGIWGDQHELRKVADVLDEIKESIMNSYVIKTGMDRESVSNMMDEETYMSAEKAVANGFADGVMYSNGLFEAKNYKGLSFNRSGVLNSAHKSIQQAIELLDDKSKAKEPEESLEMVLRLYQE